MEIEEVRKNLNKLKKSLKSKKFHSGINSVDYEDLDNYDNNYDFADDDEYRKIGSIRTLFKEFDRDYYKPIRTDGGFAGRNNNYIEYTSKGDRYENLSPKEYLNVIRPYLRDLINEHKPTVELNNTNSNNNTNNSNNNTNNSNNEENDRAEWKIQLVMQNNFISDKNFEDTRTIYSASNRIQQAIEKSNERGSGFIHASVALLYYYFQKIDIKRGESYIMFTDWIVSKKATINPNNEKDNECFKW